jgi:hypothetical protein
MWTVFRQLVLEDCTAYHTERSGSPLPLMPGVVGDVSKATAVGVVATWRKKPELQLFKGLATDIRHARLDSLNNGLQFRGYPMFSDHYPLFNPLSDFSVSFKSR